MDYCIYKDGCFDIEGAGIRLKKCFPAADGRRLAPVSAEVSGNTVCYRLAEGSVTLTLRKDPEGRICIKSSVRDLNGLHDFLPIGESEADGILQTYIQGIGMEGPSGFYDTADEIPVSHGLTALCGGSAVLTAYAEDHRHFGAAFRLGKLSTLFGTLLSFSAGFNLEGAKGTDVVLPELYLEESPDTASGLRKAAERIAMEMNARHSQPPAFYWSSWYYAYETMDLQTLDETLAGIKETGTPFQYVELDAGYAPHCGDWLIPNHRWPGGLKEAAKHILDAGLKPGIWVAPFIVGDRSQLFAEHPDWILHNLDGSPVIRLRSYTEPKIWGCPDCDYYVLDTSHPEALRYIRTVFSVLKSWGFSLFKTDFMLWNMYDSSTVRRYDPRLTSVEIMRRTLEVIREAIGEDSYLLGCIAPFMPFIGYADGMRLAGDCGARWTGAYGPLNMLRELPCDCYFNHIFWQNDPDAAILRDFGTMLNDEESRGLALLQAVSGGIVSTSDPVGRLRPDRKALLQLIRPDGPVRPELPFLGKGSPEIVLTHRLSRGCLLFVMNPTDEALVFSVPLSGLFGEGPWYRYSYDWNSEEAVSVSEETFTTALAAHGSELVFLTREPLDRKPQNLWNW